MSVKPSAIQYLISFRDELWESEVDDLKHGGENREKYIKETLQTWWERIQTPRHRQNSSGGTATQTGAADAEPGQTRSHPGPSQGLESARPSGVRPGCHGLQCRSWQRGVSRLPASPAQGVPATRLPGQDVGQGEAGRRLPRQGGGKQKGCGREDGEAQKKEGPSEDEEDDRQEGERRLQQRGRREDLQQQQ